MQPHTLLQPHRRLIAHDYLSIWYPSVFQCPVESICFKGCGNLLMPVFWLYIEHTDAALLMDADKARQLIVFIDPQHPGLDPLPYLGSVASVPMWCDMARWDASLRARDVVLHEIIFAEGLL